MDLTADWWFHAHSVVSDTTKLREMKLSRDPRSSSCLQFSVSFPKSGVITNH